MVGDVMLSRGVAKRIKAHGDNNYPFLKTRDYLKTVDIVFGNLETPIIPGREIQKREMSFRADPGVEEALKATGFSIVSLANNHTPNFGDKGLRDTFQYLSKAGISYAGAGLNEQEAYSPAFVEKNGLKFAFLAYGDSAFMPRSYRAGERRPGIAFLEKERMVSAVKAAKDNADFVIVSMHAGNEYIEEPNRNQVSFARAAIDAGAELVVGHHPHIVQKAEKYNGKYILYSMGNFVFDQMWSQKTREGLVAKAFFNEEGVSKIEFQATKIEDSAQPRLLEGEQADAILKRLKLPLGKRAVFSWDREQKALELKDRMAVYRGWLEGSFKGEKSVTTDVDGDSKQERYTLQDGRLKVERGSSLIWESPAQWWVDDFAVIDSTGDGVTDINFSVWKAGSFGSSKPFWTEENDQSVKNHFFVFDLIGGKIKAVWQSSNLDNPNTEFAFADVDNDGMQELVMLEGSYTDTGSSEAHSIVVWRWNTWGFFNEWRSPVGKFKNLTIEEVNGSVNIVVDSKPPA